MLGKKKFLWSNVLLAIVYLVFYFRILFWLSDLTTSALPDNLDTAFFYYSIVSFVFGWYTSNWAVDLWRSNWTRYNEQYEREVNAFLFHFVSLMDYKLTRHREFKKLNDLLQAATKLSKGEHHVPASLAPH